MVVLGGGAFFYERATPVVTRLICGYTCGEQVHQDNNTWCPQVSGAVSPRIPFNTSKVDVLSPLAWIVGSQGKRGRWGTPTMALHLRV